MASNVFASMLNKDLLYTHHSWFYGSFVDGPQVFASSFGLDYIKLLVLNGLYYLKSLSISSS